jgi:hypothetical protein
MAWDNHIRKNLPGIFGDIFLNMEKYAKYTGLADLL